MEYAEKYMMLRRRLLFTQQARPSSINQLNYFGINGTDSKVIVIGCSLASLIIADTLSEFGIHIIIIDKQKNQLKYTSKRQIVDYGLTILEGHKGQGSYHSYLNNVIILLFSYRLAFNNLVEFVGYSIRRVSSRVSKE